jgi:hypothetical protein
MNEVTLIKQVEVKTNDFIGELSDEALDRVWVDSAGCHHPHHCSL